MKTKYRKESSWKYELLQYETIRKFLWFNISTWNNIPTINSIYNNDVGMFIEDSYKYVSSYNEDLDKFIDKWPNIECYFVFYNHMKDSYELNK
jgi:hypothetical protein